MSKKESNAGEASIDYQQCRDDVAAAIGSGGIKYIEREPSGPISVSLKMISDCKKVKDMMFLDKSMTLARACGVVGVSRYRYFYARDNGLI